MTKEEGLKADLIRRFGFLEGKVNIRRPRRIFAEVGLENFTPLFEYVIKDLSFSMLCSITGLDEGATFVLSLIHI